VAVLAGNICNQDDSGDQECATRPGHDPGQPFLEPTWRLGTGGSGRGRGGRGRRGKRFLSPSRLLLLLLLGARTRLFDESVRRLTVFLGRLVATVALVDLERFLALAFHPVCLG